jgi:hypothetical protein
LTEADKLLGQILGENSPIVRGIGVPKPGEGKKAEEAFAAAAIKEEKATSSSAKDHSARSRAKRSNKEETEEEDLKGRYMLSPQKDAIQSTDYATALCWQKPT